ncbi:hypothetical protein [uncultured Lacinutrix sp.]|uniref:hypothetical protein n=1 Tax=uncultured Lacinutrix sp. TaxID=574032 RepID=UPI0026113424|nr:hypothetical protein [uncultured Lacinutrix sp.]
MRLLLTILLITASYTFAFAQHIKINKEQLLFLKNEDSIQVIFNYEKQERGGKRISEAKYIDNRKKKIQSKKKDTIVWLKDYKNSKHLLWPKAYISKFNERLSKYKSPELIINNTTKTNYTMQVNVLWIYSGYEFAGSTSPSKVKLDILLINNKTKKIAATLNIDESRANNSDDDNDSTWPNLRRVENAFANSGYKLAIALKRIFDKN